MVGWRLSRFWGRVAGERMKLSCLIGAHDWAGCRCRRCRQVREVSDVQHSWRHCKCSVCFKVRQSDHVWSDDECTICHTRVPPAVWAERLEARRDYRALAAIHNSKDYDDDGLGEKRDLANVILSRAGLDATDGIIEELRADGVGVATLTKLVLRLDGERAVPVLKELLARDRFGAYGLTAEVRGYLSQRDAATRDLIAEEQRRESEAQERARSAVAAYDDDAMLSMLRDLCEAYAANDAPAVRRLEPMATAIGERLNARGGTSDMRRMIAQLGGMRGARTLEMHWDGIGSWSS